MKFTLMPDYIFSTFSEANADFLLNLGIKGIILDIDNTLEPYEHPLPGDHVKLWLNSLADSGISAAFVSNNCKERVEIFNRDLSLPAFYKAGKPFKKNLVRAMEIMGTDKNNTILMGDQVFTDVWSARNAGIKAILVPPINDKKDVFTKFKRLLEAPIIKKYRRKEH